MLRTAKAVPDSFAKQTYVIGSSLTRDVGGELAKNKINATAFTYGGFTNPRIRQKVPHIFSKKYKPDNVVLLAGGNDAEHRTADHVIDEYEGLIKEIRRQCPQTKIFPGRKCSSVYSYFTLQVPHSWLYESL